MFRPYESRRPVETDDRKPDQPKSDHKSETQLAAERDAKIARAIEHKKEFAAKEAIMTEEGLSWLKERDKKRKDAAVTSKASAAAPASKGWFGGLFGSSNPPAPRQETTKTSCFPVQEKPDKVVPEAKPAKDTVIKGAVKEKEDLFSLKREEKKPKGGAKPENPNPRNGNKEPEARLENTPKKTTKEVQKELGPDWVKVKVDADTKGQAVFKNTKTGEIISPDVTGHNGSHYKLIDTKGEKRIASLDKDLESFKE